MNGKFNILPFDRGGASSNIKERVIYAQEIFNASVGFGATHDKVKSYNNTLNSEIDVCNAVKRKINSSEKLLCSANAILCAYHFESFEEVLTNDSNLNAIMRKDEVFGDALNINFKLNYVKDSSRMISSALNVNVSVNRNTLISFNSLLVLNGFFDVIKIIEKVMSLNLTIQPGSTLVIDTGNHTVYLDGVNIVDLYEGILPMPTLKPETLQIILDTGSGVLSNAGMLYRGHYL